MSDTKAIRVGIVGQGRSGHDIHLKELKHLPERFRVVAVADPIADRAAASAEEIGGRAYGSIEELLTDGDVELVVVASPNKFHADHAVLALEAGKHVLCEKPFGTRTADVDRMIAASEKAGRILQPFQQRRYAPDIRKVMEIVQSGVLGEIKFARLCWHSFKRRWDWQTLSEFAGGETNNNGPHLIDHGMELFGEGVEPTVWAQKRRFLASGDAEDHIKIILTGEGRPTIEIELSSGIAYGQDRWLVCGTNGGLRGDFANLEWKWVDWSTMPERPVRREPTPDRSYNSETLTWQSDSWTEKSAGDAGGGSAPAWQPVIDLYNGLYESIREDKPQYITPQSVRRRVAVIERCHELCPKPV